MDTSDITIAQFSKMKAMLEYYPKSRKDLKPTRQDYVNAFNEVTSKKGVAWAMAQLEVVRQEAQKAKLKAKEARLKRRQLELKEEFLDSYGYLAVGDKVKFMRSRASPKEYGRVVSICLNGECSITLAICPTRASKRSLKADGTPKLRPSFKQPPRMVEIFKEFHRIAKRH